MPPGFPHTEKEKIQERKAEKESEREKKIHERLGEKGRNDAIESEIDKSEKTAID